jgi:dephospho-CoA kinase
VTPATRAYLGGGIGSGKSTAAAVFAALGAAVLSADRAAHAVLEPEGEAAGAVAERWPRVLAEGRIDRSALAAVVFADPAARAELEAITHPAIARVLATQVAEAAGEVALVEMPLPIALLGPGWRWVVVDAPDEVRLERLIARGMEAEDAVRRMAAQPSRTDWLARADLVVDNGAGFGRLDAECRRAWDIIGSWVSPPGGSVGA